MRYGRSWSLEEVAEMRRLADKYEPELVAEARRQGQSWAEIARRLGKHRQQVWERYAEEAEATRASRKAAP